MDILLIEDDQGDALLFQKRLAVSDLHQSKVTHVTKLQHALDHLGVKHFDAVILDLKLPDSSGLDTVKHLIAGAPTLPVLVLTGNNDDKLGLEAVRLGAQDYLFKNQIDTHMLTRLIQYAIERKNASEELKKSKEKIEIEKQKLEEILKIEQGLNSIIHLDKLIDFVVKETSAILKAEKCSLIFVNEQTREMCIKGHKGLDTDHIRNGKLDLEGSIVGFVVSRGIPVLVKDIETDKEFLRKNRSSCKSNSFMSVPIKSGDELLAVINVTDKNSDEGDIFTEIDLKVLVMISRQVRAALENANLYKELNYLTITDPVTNLYNFRHFSLSLDKEIESCNRYPSSLCLFLIDVDDFKSHNDTYGHLEGDALLKNIGQCFKENLRRIDIVCRYAGDEFVVILPHTGLEKAKFVAKKLQEKIDKLSQNRKVTISLGVVQWAKGMDRFDLIQKADVALYEAKKQGKNRIVSFS